MPFQTIQCAEVGRLIKFNQVSGGPSFTGAVCTAIVSNPLQKTNTYQCQVSQDGTYAFFVTTGVEFATPGQYQLQLEYQNNGDTFYSEKNNVTALQNL